MKSEALRQMVERQEIESLATLASSDFARAAQQVGFAELLRSESFREEMRRGDTNRYETNRADRD